MNTIRIAVTAFGSVVSPLFDTAQVLELFEVVEGRTRRIENLSLVDLGLQQRIALLAGHRAELLICGAINGHSHDSLLQHGIQVHPWVSGEVSEVMDFLAARYSGEQEQEVPVKVAVSAVGDGLDSEVGPYSRRCPFLVAVDLEDLTAATIHSRSVSGELGVMRAARLMIDAEATVLLTSRCGPNAMGNLSAVGILAIPGVEGRVGDAVESYKRGELPLTASPVVPGRWCAAGAPRPGFRRRSRYEETTMEHGRSENRGTGRGRHRAGEGRGRGRGGRGKGRGRRESGGGRDTQADGDGEPGRVRGVLSRALDAMTGSTPLTALFSRGTPAQGRWNPWAEPVAPPVLEMPSREQFPIPEVVPELCTGCGICQQVCGPEAIKVVGELAVIDETECISCEACLLNCPEEAVRMPEQSCSGGPLAHSNKE